MQNRIKQIYNLSYAEHEFEVSELVYVKFQPRWQTLVYQWSSTKLVACFYDLFKIIWKISKVAYELQLLPTSHIHSIFHMSLLKQHKGPSSMEITFDLLDIGPQISKDFK